jgi:hypothetical protein
MVDFAVSLQQCWLLYGNKYQFIEWVKWLAATLMILNVVIITVSITAANSPWTYASFILAHCFWAYGSYKGKEWQIFWQSMAMIPLNMYGIYIRL